MRFIKLGIISFIVLFLLITAMSLLLPSSIHISRAIDVNAPFDSVYAQITDLQRWKTWYSNYDSTTAVLSKKTTGKGASLQMNNTFVSILGASATQVKTVWKAGSNSMEGEFNVIKQEGSGQVTVQWHFLQPVKWYPWEKFASIVSSKSIGFVMEKSLSNLKQQVEK